MPLGCGLLEDSLFNETEGERANRLPGIPIISKPPSSFENWDQNLFSDVNLMFTGKRKQLITLKTGVAARNRLKGHMPLSSKYTFTNNEVIL